MDPSSPVQRARLHPLIATAAISVIVLSAVGVTAFVMNRSGATPSPYDAPAPAVAAVRPDLAATQPSPTAAAAPAVASVPGPLPSAAPTQRLAAVQPATGPSTPSYALQPAYAQPPASTPAYDAPPRVAQAGPVCRHCGVVDSIREIKVKGEGTGVGAVGGAVVGGLVGNMVGAGRGKALATVAGAVGGGFGGNAIEKNVRSTVQYRMLVRLNDGTTRTFTQSQPFGYGIGERVRVVNGHVERA